MPLMRMTYNRHPFSPPFIIIREIQAVAFSRQWCMLSDMPFWTRGSIVYHGQSVIVVWRLHSTWSAHSRTAADENYPNYSWIVSTSLSSGFFNSSMSVRSYPMAFGHIKHLVKKTVGRSTRGTPMNHLVIGQTDFEPLNCCYSLRNFGDISLFHCAISFNIQC